MVKYGIMEKSNSNDNSSNKFHEQKITVQAQHLAEVKMLKYLQKSKKEVTNKSNFNKKDSLIPIMENMESSLYSDKVNGGNENNSKLNKKVKLSKMIKELENNQMAFPHFGQVKLSQTVIISSVLKINKVDQKIDAELPKPLHSIYLRFINNKKYFNSFCKKEDYFCGIGLLGINIEDKIYNKRKALEESLKRGIRLRPNPKPTKLFDGTVISRPSRNNNSDNNILKSLKSFEDRSIFLRCKRKYNVFNIGTAVQKKASRRGIRKPIKKKLILNDRSITQKLFEDKESHNQNFNGSSDEDPENSDYQSIAFSRPKRQQKIPKLDFKYCYNDRIKGYNRKNGDSNSDDVKSIECEKELLEIIDSDTSSVVEVLPPNDIDLSDESDGFLNRSRDANQSCKSKCPINMRKGWKPKESKALNLLDKLRLGLQCTIIQTENDIIVQNLSHDDLGTLQSRLQGLATFKNIEAEYDLNGQETARATIDRKILNLPLRTSDISVDIKSSHSGKNDDTLKRQLINSQFHADRKKILLTDKPIVENNKVSKITQQTNNVYKIEECSSWIRPKSRSVKKVRKLYTQSGNTPNILSRSQILNRSNKLLVPATRSASSQSLVVSKNHTLSSSQESNMGGTIDSSGGHNITSVSFYPQPATVSSQISSTSVVSKPMISEIIKPVPSLTNDSAAGSLKTNDMIDLCNNTDNISTTNNFTIDSSTIPLVSEDIFKKPEIIEDTTSSTRVIDSVCPATAMSASQLLMLKRGGQNMTETTVTMSNTILNIVNSTDQSFSNQILKPFQKTFISSSPPKLELDDEEIETDFELTPSMITQVKNVTAPINLSNYPYIQSKNNFLSKPLIQSSGILPNSRRTINLTNTPLFQAQNSLLNSVTQLSTCLPSNGKSLNLIDKSLVCVVTAQSVVLPSISITTTANNNNSSQTNMSNNNQSITQNSNSAVKIKQRKWTHNFHTSNSINFREVLCSSSSNNPHVKFSMSNAINTVTHVKQQIQTIPNTNSTNIISPLRIPETTFHSPSKCPSTVLKSLLVESNNTNDLCNINKTANWASKYLSSTSSLQDNSKIKWQVGGTVVTSLANLISPVSKESATYLDQINININK